MSAAATRDVLLRLLEPVVADAGLDLEDVTVTPAGKRRLVRVVVDRDGGVSLDDVAAVSTAVSQVLDDNETADAALGRLPYVLEVSSPGIDRPLTQPRHWRRALGRLVQVTSGTGAVLTGRVLAVAETPEGPLLSLAATDAAPQDEPRRVPLASLGSGRVLVEFSRPAADAEEGA